MANHEQLRPDRRHQYGGRLTLTNQRFFFTPNRLDRRVGAEAWQVRLTDVVSVAVQPPTRALRGNFGNWQGTEAAQMQNRLSVSAGDRVELFMLNGNVVRASEQVRGHISSSRPDWPGRLAPLGTEPRDGTGAVSVDPGASNLRLIRRYFAIPLGLLAVERALFRTLMFSGVTGVHRGLAAIVFLLVTAGVLFGANYLWARKR